MIKRLLVACAFALASTTAIAQSLPTPNFGGININGSAISCSDLSGVAASCSTDTTNAANISSGTLPSARLPIPSASALGGILSSTSPTGEYADGVDTSGNVTYRAPPASCANILDPRYGGNNGGSVDNTAAFAAAVASQPTGQVCVEFPAGTYYFASSAAYIFPGSSQGLRITGAGKDATVLKFANGIDGITVTEHDWTDSTSIDNLTIATESTNLQSGIIFNNGSSVTGNSAAASSISHVTLRGADGYALTNGWLQGIDINAVPLITFNDVTFQGPGGAHDTGAYISGTATAISTVYNFVGCNFNNLDTGIVYGNHIQGISVIATNFVYFNTGISVPSSESDLDQLSVVGSQFGMAPNGAIISVNSLLPHFTVTSNLFFQSGASSVGIYFNTSTAGLYSISGNSFDNSGSPAEGTAIVITSNTFAGIITGNSFYNLNTGVNLEAGSSTNNVQSNVYSATTTAVANSGTGNTVGGGSN